MSYRQPLRNRNDLIARNLRVLESFVWHARHHLNQDPSTGAPTQHRDKKKNKFSLEMSCKVGVGSFNAGNWVPFRKGVPHFKKNAKGKGKPYYTKTVMEQYREKKINAYHVYIYNLAREIIELIAPEWAGDKGEFNVNISWMNDRNKHYVQKHVDAEDTSHQYAVGLGNYKGAKLRCYESKESDDKYVDFDYRHKVLKMDGRLPHELILDGFEGDRFTIIWYKNYDSRQTKEDGICKTPEIVFTMPEVPEEE